MGRAELGKDALIPGGVPTSVSLLRTFGSRFACFAGQHLRQHTVPARQVADVMVRPGVAAPVEALSSEIRSGAREGVSPHTDRAPEENPAAEKTVHFRDTGQHVARTVREVEPHLIGFEGFA